MTRTPTNEAFDALLASLRVVQMEAEPSPAITDIVGAVEEVARAAAEDADRLRLLARNAPDIIYRYDLAPIRGFH